MGYILIGVLIGLAISATIAGIAINNNAKQEYWEHYGEDFE